MRHAATFDSIAITVTPLYNFLIISCDYIFQVLTYNFQMKNCGFLCVFRSFLFKKKNKNKKKKPKKQTVCTSYNHVICDYNPYHSLCFEQK